MADESRRRLGRGLAALLGDAAADATPAERPRGPRKAPIEFLRPNPRNPRISFREEDLAELTASIREKGVIQPIIVRVIVGVADAYEIIAGERRWRAAQMAGLSDVPVVIHEANDKEALELAIIENVQRADLNAVEEAKGYERLGAEFGYSHGDIAKIIGKSRSHIANTIRMLNLPEEAKKLVAEGAISAGHARALLAVADPAAVARRIVEKGLTVRDVERLAKDHAEEAGRSGRSPRSAKDSAKNSTKNFAKDADARAIEKTLSDALGMRVELRAEDERGELRIRYESLEQLDSICRLLTE
ncbi:ParB/RepB/Spo0J family partition protein [Methylocystis sp.]|uniref:ParB/RepB/Spo0J family partition protein n=1 Tax=Methylocystis sp. TaxID=1911079 RepID=UPI003DA5D7FE